MANKKLEELGKQVKDLMAAQAGTAQNAKEQFEKMAKESTKVAEQMKEMLKTVNQVVDGTKNIVDNIVASREAHDKVQQAYEATRNISEEINTLSKSNNAISSHSAELANDEVKINKDCLAEYKDITVELKKQLSLHEQELAVRSKFAAQAVANVNAAAGAAVDAKGAITGLLASLPMVGGILNFLMYGEGQNDRWNAEVSKVIIQFNSVSGGMDGLAKNSEGLKDKLRKMSAEGHASVEEVMAVGNAFAHAGRTGEETFGDKFTGSIGETSLKLDKLYQVGAGTSANHALKMTRDFGGTMEKNTEFIKKYAFAAERAGMHGMDFMNSVAQSTESLRLNNYQLTQSADLMLKLSEGYGKTRAGGNKQLAGQQAAAGVQGITQGVTSMQDGLAAFIGSKMGYGLDNPFKAISMFKHAGQDVFANNGKSDSEFMKKAINEIGNLMKTGDQHKDAWAIQKVTGLSEEGSIAMIKLQKELSGKDGKMTADQEKRWKNIWADEGTKKSATDRAWEAIQMNLAKISHGLLGLILSGIKMIIESITWLGAKMAAGTLDLARRMGFADQDDVDTANAAAEAAAEGLSKDKKAFGTSSREIGDAVVELLRSIVADRQAIAGKEGSAHGPPTAIGDAIKGMIDNLSTFSEDEPKRKQEAAVAAANAAALAANADRLKKMTEDAAAKVANQKAGEGALEQLQQGTPEAPRVNVTGKPHATNIRIIFENNGSIFEKKIDGTGDGSENSLG